MASSGYELVVFWSDEDQVYVAHAAELPGCVGVGATQPQAVANCESMIGEWIARARELGRDVPQPKGAGRDG